MEELSSQYQLLESKTGHKVPVVRGVYLHSIYEPLEEAHKFVESYEKQLLTKSNILVLGLGFGYHIQQVESFLRENFDSYSITVLEVNANVIRDMREFNPVENENIRVIHVEKISELYLDSRYIELLQSKPVIMRYSPSFNLDKNLYQEILTYQASSKISDYVHVLSEASKELLPGDSGFETYDEMMDMLKSRSGVENKGHHLFLALDAIVGETRLTDN